MHDHPLSPADSQARCVDLGTRRWHVFTDTGEYLGRTSSYPLEMADAEDDGDDGEDYVVYRSATDDEIANAICAELLAAGGVKGPSLGYSIHASRNRVPDGWARASRADVMRVIGEMLADGRLIGGRLGVCALPRPMGPRASRTQSGGT